MDHKGLKKYFTPKNMIPQIIGAVICAFGVFVAVVDWVYFGAPIIIVGVCVILFTRDSRVSDEEVDRTVASKIKDLDERTRADIGVREREMRGFMPESFSGYEFAEDVAVARGRDLKLRSDRYAAAELVFTQECIHAYVYRFCLTKDEDSERRATIKYGDIGDAAVTERTVAVRVSNVSKGEQAEVTVHTLEILDGAGEPIISIPVGDGADVDRVVTNIKRLAEREKAKSDT